MTINVELLSEAESELYLYEDTVDAKLSFKGVPILVGYILFIHVFIGGYVFYGCKQRKKI